MICLGHSYRAKHNTATLKQHISPKCSWRLICFQSNPECSHHDLTSEKDPNEGQPHRRYSLCDCNVFTYIKNATSTYATPVTTTSGFHFTLTCYEFLQTQNKKVVKICYRNTIQPVYFISTNYFINIPVQQNTVSKYKNILLI